MAPQRTAEEEAAIKAAMIAELGSARLDTLPCEDNPRGGRGYLPPSSTTTQLRKPAINSKWAQAIQNGDFEDDDAQQVKGIDSLDDGNMARRRRQQAAQTAFQYVNCNYSASKLPRDQNGQVPPRSRFPGAKRVGNAMSDRARFDNDEPVDISATFEKAMRHAVPPRELKPAVSSRTPRVVSSPSARTLKIGCTKKETPEPKAATIASAVTQDAPQMTRSAPQLLPGASIMLEMVIEMQSAILPMRDRRYKGKVLLMMGRNSSDDKIIFALAQPDEQNVEHSITDYCNRMDISNESLMLNFRVNNKHIYYALEFGSAVKKTSFDISLRELVERSKLGQVTPKAPEAMKSGTPANKETLPTAAIPPEAVISSSVPIFSESPVAPKVMIPGCPSAQNQEAKTVGGSASAAFSQPTSASEAQKEIVSEAVVQYPVRATTPSKVASTTVSPQLTEAQLDEIVDCVVDTATYMRDCTPEEYSIDVMKSIIRGATAAFMMRKNADFSKLSARKRAELVEGHWIPAVTDRFFCWLRENHDKGTQNGSAEMQSGQKNFVEECLDNRGIIEVKVRRVYSKVELMALKPAAVEMAHQLPGKRFFEDPNLEARRQREREAVTRRAQLSVPSVESQIQRAASAMDWLNGGGQSPSAMLAQTGNSTRPYPQLILADLEAVQAKSPTKIAPADHDSTKDFADWVYGPKKIEPAKKHTGLNHSIHNQSNADVLGANAGQFTGVFTQTADFQDLVDIFDKEDQKRDEISPLTQDFRRLSLR